MKKVIIDTSSLLSLVRYYLPFDLNNILFEFVKKKVEQGNIVVIDEVLKESEFTSKKLVIKTLDYLTDKNFKKTYNIPFKTGDLIPPSPQKFYNMVDNNFRTSLSQRLNEAEYAQRKQEFLHSADGRMIILARIEKFANNEVIIVTEESETANDNKDFKKIPSICQELQIEVMTLPELLASYEDIKIEFK